MVFSDILCYIDRLQILISELKSGLTCVGYNLPNVVVVLGSGYVGMVNYFWLRTDWG